MEQMNAPCPRCLRETHQTVLHQVVQTLEDEVSHEVYRLIECAGCHTISMAHLSFYDDFDFRVVREHHAGLHSFRNMRRMEARRRKARALWLRHSQSLASRRQRPSQAKVRSTIQRLGSATKPVA